jgi:hypothetical protein
VWGNGPYTDGSDIISAAVHTGRVRWSDVLEARRRGRNARVEVQVVPAAERMLGVSAPRLMAILKMMGGSSSVQDRATGMKVRELRFLM